MKGRILVLSTLLGVLISNTSVAGFDDEYTARMGDYNNDGLVDIYVAKKPGIVLLHGEIITPIVLPAEVEDFILQQNSDQFFQMISGLSNDQVGLGTSSPEAPINLLLSDYNLDGVVDLFLDGVGAVISGASDVLVLADQRVGSPPFSATSFTDEVTTFLDQVAAWSSDPMYFDNNANIVTTTETVNDSIFLAESCANQAFVDLYGPLENFPPIPVLIGNSLDDIISNNETFVLHCIRDGKDIIHYDNVRVQYEVVRETKDFSIFNQDALVFVDIYARAQNSNFSDAADIADMEEILTDVLGYPLNSLTVPRRTMSDIHLGDDDAVVNEAEFTLRKVFLGRLIGLIVFAEFGEGRNVFNDRILGEVFNSDPAEWQPHFYGVESDICAVGEDTMVVIPGQGGGRRNSGIIRAEHCTLENVFCWSKRRPAPRANQTDESLAENEGPETLAGVPLTDRTDPIVTWVNDERFTHRNETQPGHILHDPSQSFGCADLGTSPTVEDIPERCSFVDRQVAENSDGVIQVLTTGGGFNPIITEPPVVGADGRLVPGPTYDIVEFNEVGGAQIFRGVDVWIQEQLIDRGACPR